MFAQGGEFKVVQKSYGWVTTAPFMAGDWIPDSGPQSLKYMLMVMWCSMQIRCWMTISWRRGCFSLEGTAVPGVVSILFVVMGEEC